MIKKIISFHFIEVKVPAKEGAINTKGIYKPLHMLPVSSKAGASWSQQFDELPKLIVKMKLEDGSFGLGEFYRDHNWQVIENVAKSLIGLDIFSLNLNKLPIGLYREYDGFECAIWDAYAKCLGISLTQLLGGAMRDKVKISAWSSFRETAAEAGQVAMKFQQQGYDTIKFKSELGDDIVSWAEAIKHKAKGMHVIIDPNQRWENLGETKALTRELEKIGNVFCLEDPMPLWMLQDYEKLREFSAIRIVRHISLPYIYQGQRLHDAINVLSHKAADGFNFNGGLASFRQLDAICHAAGMHCWHGSEIDLGILEAMYTHQCAAAFSCVWPSDIFGRLIRQHDLLKTPLKIVAPYIYPPKGPGLGIQLDEETINTFKQQEREIN